MRPFEQVNSEHPRGHEGAGLGLNICAGLMKAFGGTLDIQSKVGVGTTVTLRFPSERTVRSS
jgi:two-component system cell cycle sensor histidine kinase PleC